MFLVPRVLDPSGVILQIVCEPVRRYLRTRDDTVRCIVQSLIDDGSSELSEELSKGEGLCLEESFEDEEDKELFSFHWNSFIQLIVRNDLTVDHLISCLRSRPGTFTFYN